LNSFTRKSNYRGDEILRISEHSRNIRIKLREFYKRSVFVLCNKYICVFFIFLGKLANPNIFVMNAATVKIIVPLKRVCLVINYSPFILSIFEYMQDKGKLAFYIFLFVELTSIFGDFSIKKHSSIK
ncbi:hypothetical protein, partial [Peribacillus frigoritolerans]|uniref:hypothetical protein n=1 Tax=Peribacillus frigoritolerans TaxID=450367 RepID=UPI00363592BE